MQVQSIPVGNILQSMYDLQKICTSSCACCSHRIKYNQNFLRLAIASQLFFLQRNPAIQSECFLQLCPSYPKGKHFFFFFFLPSSFIQTSPGQHIFFLSSHFWEIRLHFSAAAPFNLHWNLATGRTVTPSGLSNTLLLCGILSMVSCATVSSLSLSEDLYVVPASVYYIKVQKLIIVLDQIQ